MKPGSDKRAETLVEMEKEFNQLKAMSENAPKSREGEMLTQQVDAMN